MHTQAVTLVYMLMWLPRQTLALRADGCYMGPWPAGMFRCGTCNGGADAWVCLCEPGTFQSNPNQDSCTACPAGTYSNANGATTCTQCIAGTYSTAVDATACTKCPSGTYNTAIGSQYPMELYYNGQCTSNWVYVRMDNGCESPTPYPTYKCTKEWRFLWLCQNANNNFWMISADSIGSFYGWYGPGGGMTPLLEASTNINYCFLCPVGTYTPNAGSSSCTACSAGTYSTALGASATSGCTSCPAGYSTNGTVGQTMCTQCPQGTYADKATGASLCIQCPEGTFSIGSGTTACVACTRGTYTSATLQTTCLTCATGTFASSERATTCDPCPAGTYAHITGASACSPCPNGIGSYPGSSACVSCI